MQNFAELEINPAVLKAINERGYTTPSPIQAQALPILLGEPTDFLGLAATGTGKTAAFTIPLLQRLDPKVRGVQGLILCPTRELAIQVSGQINLLGKHLGVKALPIYGGAGYGDQIYGLKNGANIVVGTPGRLVDHIDKGTLKLDGLHTVILDEADEMISMGFKDDLEAILGATTEGASNIWLFSATMSPGVRRVADSYLKDPQQVQVNRTEMLPETVEQIYYLTSESNKPEVLCKLIEAADDFYGLIFFQTKALVMELTDYLRTRGYSVDCLHGDMDQNARDRTMRAFRNRNVTVLLCTDVASRGLDVKDVTHVINYSLPRELDNYVHRIGRTARSGKSGLALSLVSGAHRGLIPRIERLTKRKMREGKIPTRKEIGAKKVSKLLETFKGQEFYARAVELLDADWKTALAGMTAEEIAGRFVALLNPEIFSERRETKQAAVASSPVVPMGGAGPAVRFGEPAAVIVRAGRTSPVEGAARTGVTRAIVAPVATPVASSASPWAKEKRPWKKAPREGDFERATGFGRGKPSSEYRGFGKPAAPRGFAKPASPARGFAKPAREVTPSGTTGFAKKKRVGGFGKNPAY